MCGAAGARSSVAEFLLFDLTFRFDPHFKTSPLQMLLHLDGEDVVGLRAFVQLLQQLVAALPEVCQLLVEGRAAAAAADAVGVCSIKAAAAVVVVGVGGVVVGLLGCLGRMIDVKALVLEELDDGELGQVQLSGQRVDGLLVWIQTHVLYETLQDSQSLQGDLASTGARLDAADASGSASVVLGLGR